MKKMMILAAALMMGAVVNAKEDKVVKPFEGVSVNIPARVRFVYGNEYKVDVQSNDKFAAAGVRVSVKDGVLKIRSVDDHQHAEDLYITIESPVEPKLTVGRNMEVKNTKRAEKFAKHD